MEFDQRGAVLAKEAIVSGKLTEVGLFSGRQCLKAGFTVLGPTQYGLRVQWALVRSAMASRFATAGFQFIHRALGELAQGKKFIDPLLKAGQVQKQLLAREAGAMSGSGPERIFSVCYIP